MFRLCLSNRKKRATNKGELGDLKVSFRARYPKGRLRTQETGAIEGRMYGYKFRPVLAGAQ